MADDYLPPDVDVDFSVIRTSIDMGHKVLDQILHGVHYGSEEIRNLLRAECDFIMECKVCRNMFRSFPNFVAHKRVYCRRPYIETLDEKEVQSVVLDTEAVVVQPEPVLETDSVTSIAKSASKEAPLDRESNSSVVDKVINQTFEGKSNDYKLYTKVAQKHEKAKASKKLSSIKLSAIPSNPNAVMVDYSQRDLAAEIQTSANVFKSNNGTESSQGSPKKKDIASTDGMVKKKASLTDICKGLVEDRATSNPQQIVASVKSPGKLVGRSRKSSPRRSVDHFIGMRSPQSPMEVESCTAGEKCRSADHVKVDEMDPLPTDVLLQICDMNLLKCKKCDRTFSTSSKLKFHARMKHVGSLYNCTGCDKTFVYFTTLAEHLRKDHKKTEVAILQLRESYRLKKKLEMSVLTANTDSSESPRSSPVKDGSRMLPYSTGWKKCDKCDKVCWKKSSYVKHYKYCKGNKSSDSETSEQKPLTSSEKVVPTSIQSTVTEIIVHPPTKPAVTKSFKVVDVSRSFWQEINEGVKSKASEIVASEEEASTSKTSVNVLSSHLTSDSIIPSCSAQLVQSSDNTTTNTSDTSNQSKTVDRQSPIKRPGSVTPERSKKDDTQKSGKSQNIRLFGRRSISSERKLALDELKEHLKAQHLTCAGRSQAEQEGNDNNNDAKKDGSVNAQKLEKKRELRWLEMKLARKALGKQELGVKNQTTDFKKDRKVVSPTENQRNIKQSETVTEEIQNNCDESNSAVKAAGKSVETPVKVSTSDRVSVMSSCPTSPLSVSSSSCEDYNAKFKMTVKEMAELVETASLTKFAKDRKKKAHNLLNAKQSKAKKNLEAALARPMKKQISRRKVIVVRKVYGTRHSTQCSGGEATEHRTGEEKNVANVPLRKSRSQFRTLKARQSRGASPSVSPAGSAKSSSSDRLAREIKRLENSQGFVASKHFIPSLPVPNTLSDGQTTDKKGARELARLKNSDGFVETVKASDGSGDKRVNRERSADIEKRASIEMIAQKSNDNESSNGSGKIEEKRPESACINRIEHTQKHGEINQVGMFQELPTNKDSVQNIVTDNKRQTRELARLGHSAGFVDKTAQYIMEERRSRDISRDRRSHVSSDKGSETSRDSSRETEGRRTHSKDDVKHSHDANEIKMSKVSSENAIGTTQFVEKKRVSVIDLDDCDGMQELDSPRNMNQKNISDFFVRSSPKLHASQEEEHVNPPSTAYASITKMNSMCKMMLAARRSIKHSKNVMNQTNPLKNKSPQKIKPSNSASKLNEEGVPMLKDVRNEAVSSKLVDNFTKNITIVTVANPSLSLMDVKKFKKRVENETEAPVHRTRLSTGSIIFDSEQLKTSPSKLAEETSDSDKKEDDYELINTNRTRHKSESTVVRKLDMDCGHKARSPINKRNACLKVANTLLSVKAAKSKLQKAKGNTEMAKYPLSTGVKQCAVCGKRFWKYKSYKYHTTTYSKCQGLSRKRTLSQANDEHKTLEKDQGVTDDEGVKTKKAKVDKKKHDESNKLVSVTTSDKKAEASKNEADQIVEQELPKRDTNVEKLSAGFDTSSPQKGVNMPDVQNNTTIDKSVMNEDSDAEVEFCGFSEEELHVAELNQETAAAFDVSLNSELGFLTSDDEMLPSDTDSSENDRKDKSIGRSRKADNETTTGSAEVTRDQSRKIKHYFTFVRDADNPSKIVCHSYKDLMKIIDVKKVKCLQCDTPCTNLSNLRRHAVNHLGWKRYKCLGHLCSFKCYDMSQIRLHCIRSHGQKLVKSNFNKFVLDLKKEATRKNNAKRVRTMQLKKEREKLAKEELYAKPRKPFKKGKDTDDVSETLTVSTVSYRLPVTGSSNNDMTSKEGNASSPLFKARMSLSKALQK